MPSTLPLSAAPPAPLACRRECQQLDIVRSPPRRFLRPRLPDPADDGRWARKPSSTGSPRSTAPSSIRSRERSSSSTGPGPDGDVALRRGATNRDLEREGRLPGRPVLPPARLRDRAATASGLAREHPSARVALHQPAPGGARAGRGPGTRAADARLRRLLLAGDRAGAGEALDPSLPHEGRHPKARIPSLTACGRARRCPARLRLLVVGAERGPGQIEPTRRRSSGGRGVAQLGRARALGARGRRFESCLPDQIVPVRGRLPCLCLRL
jgi:hypothetical protein